MRSRRGYPFPSFIVLERGETLRQWSVRPRKLVEAAVMVEALADLLKELHSCDRVHRDLYAFALCWCLPCSWTCMAMFAVLLHRQCI